jgi:hypothetical protein
VATFIEEVIVVGMVGALIWRAYKDPLAFTVLFCFVFSCKASVFSNGAQGHLTDDLLIARRLPGVSASFCLAQKPHTQATSYFGEESKGNGCHPLLAVGTNPKVFQETLGHANVSVTLGIYSHLLPNMQDEVAQKINELPC